MEKTISFLILLTVLLSACGGTPATANGAITGKMIEYVGEIPGTGFFVASAVGSSGDVLA